MTIAMTNPEARAVPKPIYQALRRMIRRARMMILIRGLCAVIVAAVGSLLAVMAVDFLVTPFSLWPRWALAGSALGVTALTAAWMLVRPLARAFTLTGVARAIESRHPELHERMSSAIELLTSPDAPHLRGSQALIEALAQEAAIDAKGVQPRREVTLRVARPHAIAALAVVAILVGVYLAWPQKAGLLMARAVAPFRNLPNVAAGDLLVDPDHDSVLAQGQRLHVEIAVAHKAVKAADLIRIDAGGRETVEAMTPLSGPGDEARRFAVTCAPAGANFRYRIQAGDAQTRLYNVSVVPLPAVTRLDVRYDYPAYTGRASITHKGFEGDIRAVAGTAVTLTAVANKPLASLEFLLDGQAAPAQRVNLPAATAEDAACALRIKLEPGTRGQWSLRLTDKHGFSGTLPPRAIEALKDAPPIVRMLSPEGKELKLNRKDRLPIVYSAEDDFGLTKVEMLVESESGKLAPVALALPQAATLPSQPAGPRGIGRTTLDLASLDLAHARTLTVKLAAQDNLPAEAGGPQIGYSEACTILLDAGAPAYALQVQLSEELKIRTALQEVLKELQAAKLHSAQLEQDVPKVKALSEAMVARIDSMRRSLATADTAVRDLAAQVSGGAFGKMAEKLSDLADKHISQAESLGGRIKLADEGEARNELAKNTDFHVYRAVEIVSNMLKDFDILSELANKAQELQDLADRQAELAAAKAAAEMTPEQLAAMQAAGASATSMPAAAGQPPTPMNKADWQKAEGDLAKKLAELSRKTPGATPVEAGKDEKETRDLVGEARSLAKSQMSLAGDTQRIAEIQEAEKAAQELAKQQEALARQAAGEKATTEQAKPMSQAAEQIRRNELMQAAKAQEQAQTALKAQADALNRQARASQLAAQAKAIADQEKSLAQQAAAAKQAGESAAAKAQAAAGQAQEAQRKAQQLSGQLGPKAAEIQKRQQDLAGKARNLEKSLPDNPLTAPAGETKPSSSMDAAAEGLKNSDIAKAAAESSQAAGQAQQLAGQLADLARKAQQTPTTVPAEQARQQAAQAAAEQAQKIAQEQKAVADDVAKLSPTAKELAQATAAAAAAGEEQARQAKAAGDAQQQTAGLGQAQDDLGKQAADLRKQAEGATAAARDAVGQNDPAPAMAKAAEAMKARQPAQAEQAATQAAAKAAQLADALAKADAAGGPADQKATQAGKASELARQQEELQKKTAELAAKRDAAQKAYDESQHQRLKAEQADVARQAGELADTVLSQASQPDNVQISAARLATEASRQMQDSKLAQAGESAAQAAAKLTDLARRLGAEVGKPQAATSPAQTQPAREPTSQAVAVKGANQQEPQQIVSDAGEKAQARARLAERTADLAQRQQQLALQMKALADNQPRQLIDSRQEQIAKSSSKLAEAVDLIRTHEEELIPNPEIRQETAQAQAELAKAAAAQAQARQALAAGAPRGAVPPQQASSAAMHAAADALERLGQKLAQEARKNPPPDAEPADEITDAYDAAAKAAKTQQPTDAALAAELLKQLSAQAMAMAQQMGLVPMDQQWMNSAQATPGGAVTGRGAGMMTVAPSVGELEQMGITLSDWAKLPGELRDGILQASGDASPEEYRSLIKRYFQALSKRGAAMNDK